MISGETSVERRQISPNAASHFLEQNEGVGSERRALAPRLWGRWSERWTNLQEESDSRFSSRRRSIEDEALHHVARRRRVEVERFRVLLVEVHRAVPLHEADDLEGLVRVSRVLLSARSSGWSIGFSPSWSVTSKFPKKSSGRRAKASGTAPALPLSPRFGWMYVVGRVFQRISGIHRPSTSPFDLVGQRSLRPWRSRKRPRVRASGYTAATRFYWRRPISRRRTTTSRFRCCLTGSCAPGVRKHAPRAAKVEREVSERTSWVDVEALLKTWVPTTMHRAGRPAPVLGPGQGFQLTLPRLAYLREHAGVQEQAVLEFRANARMHRYAAWARSTVF